MKYLETGGSSHQTNLGDVAPSEINPEGTTVAPISISDEILYDYLKTMRVPHADIIVAQAFLESQDFNSNLFKRQNNFLGMKIPRQRISTTGQGKGEYKDYANWQECTTDYIFWMHHHQAHKLNRDEYFNLLGKIYAEDPEYVEKLKGIISQFKFK